MLDRSKVKWRVIVISGCYAGGFFDTPKDGNSLIVTAARKDKTSFGCSNELDYTYFGKAYFDEALRTERSFIDAFPPAVESVTRRERAEGYAPSEPQIFVGDAIRGKLAELEMRFEAAR